MSHGLMGLDYVHQSFPAGNSLVRAQTTRKARQLESASDCRGRKSTEHFHVYRPLSTSVIFSPFIYSFFRTCNLDLILKSFRPEIIPLLDELFFLIIFFPVFVIANREGKDC